MCQHRLGPVGPRLASVVTAGTQILRSQTIGLLFAAVILVSVCVFQSTGKAKAALLLSLSRQGVFFAVVILTFSYMFGYYGTIAAQPAADFLAAVLAVSLLSLTVGKEIREKT